MKSLGIVAGNGSLPLEILEEAKRQGLSVHVCAVRGEASETLIQKADSYERVWVGQLGKLIRYFKSKNVSRVIFGGKIQKTNILKGEVRPDLEMLLLFAKVRDRKDDTLLGTIANHLTRKGLEVIDSTTFLKNSLPLEGVLTGGELTAEEMKNVRFGFEMAKAIAGLDIGQTVVVKDMSVVAVESVEGTDLCIRRGGELAGGGITVVKVAKPQQDMRFDVPAVGLETLKVLREAGAKVLALEAGKTLLVEKEKFLKEAAAVKLKVIAYRPQ